MIRSFVSFLFFAILALAEPADWIVTARYVVTMDPARRLIEDGAVAVRGERIAAVDTRAAILKQFQAKRTLDRPKAILLPGLVNAHAHAPMSLLRGIADDLKLQEWLEKYIFPAEAKNVTPEFVRWGTRLACLEMALGGVTTYADMYYFEDVVAEATKEAGLRGVLGQTIINFPVPDAKTPAEGLARAEAFIRRFQRDPLIVPAVAPHAVYTNTEESIRASRALANRYGVPLVTHLSETKTENDESRAKWQLSPTALLDKWGAFEGRTLVAHAVWVDEADRKILRERGVGVAHCPSSNTKLASGVAPVVAMIEAGLAVGLGTDGPAGSNNDFNLFEEMDLAAKLQKVSTGDPRALPARQALEMATILGARAVSLEKEIGSLEAGKRADLITVSLDQPHAVPMYDVYSQLVYALKASDVADVMVNGRWIVRDRRSLTLDWPAIAAKAGEFRARISASLGK
jgi:5-methylthioadenosine/S-adenosylhomocysteine deaminase